MSAAAAGARWERLLRPGFWIVPPVAAVWFHWSALKTWFMSDDFAWLIHSTEFYNFREFLRAVFEPRAQGTIRPWSDRIFFIVFYRIFGLDPIPFHAWALLTQCANVLLLLSIVRRLTGSRLAAFLAALLWTVNTSQPVALAWTSAYNEPLCALFVLGAFRFLLRYIETGERRYWRLQWVVFLLGFGALELNVMYPALAAAYTFLCARKHFVKTLPLFVPSVVFAIVHRWAAPAASGLYVMHFGTSMLSVLYTYWTWALGPGFLATMIPMAPWVFAASILAMTLALLGVAAWRAWMGDRLPLFGLLWFLFLITPVLPLSDHHTEYYPFLPSIGLALAGGWAFTLAWRRPAVWKALSVVLVLIYGGFSVAAARRSLEWELRRSRDVRKLIRGIERAHELHPSKMILIDNVDDELFWTGVRDHPFGLVGAQYVYLTPGSDKQIASHPALGDLAEFILPPGLTWRALVSDRAVVYRVESSILRNITKIYTDVAPPEWESMKPSRIDLSVPSEGYLLGPEWHEIEGNHRWMPRRATVRLAAPQRAGAKLHLTGSAGPKATVVAVTVDGIKLPERKVDPGQEFDLAWPLPDEAFTKPATEIVLETDNTITLPHDGRPLGLVFGVIEIVE